MSFDFRLPSITGSDTEKIAQLTRYIYRLTEQLNFSLNTIEGAVHATGATGSVTSAPSVTQSEEEKLEGAYASIKSMIIKSADFIESLTDKVSVSLGGAYLAKSEFGTYKETTNAAIEANSTGITQLYSYTSNLQSDYADYDVENKSYIKTGLLYNDGSQPVYGVGVGLLNATTDANGRRTIDRQNLATTFTAGRISFWGNDKELAYATPSEIYFPEGVLKAYGAEITGKITATAGTIGGCKIENNKLVIDAAHITGTLEIGRLPNNIAKTSDIPTAVSALENDSGYQNESGVVSIVNGRVTADYVQSLGITVDAAMVTGKLTASQIDASDLKVSAANITGQLTASQIDASELKVSAANITGKLEAAKLEVGEKLSADKDTESVTIGGWIVEDKNIHSSLPAFPGSYSGTSLSGKSISGVGYMVTYLMADGKGVVYRLYDTRSLTSNYKDFRTYIEISDSGTQL